MKMTKRVKKELPPISYDNTPAPAPADDNNNDSDQKESGPSSSSINNIKDTTPSDVILHRQEEQEQNAAVGVSNTNGNVAESSSTTTPTTSPSKRNEDNDDNSIENNQPPRASSSVSLPTKELNHLNSESNMTTDQKQHETSKQPNNSSKHQQQKQQHRLSKQAASPVSASTTSSSSSFATFNTASAADPTMVLRENLIREFKNGEHDCLICSNPVKAAHAVWNCTTCYKSYHLFCIKTWCKKSNQQQQENNSAAAASAVTNPNNESYFAREAQARAQFRCPSCNTTSQVPQEYKCFCGKQVDPKLDPYITPHSCGEICGKPRGNGCIHGTKCPLPCHPGPCGRCTAPPIEHACPCGKSVYSHPCGTPDPKKTCDNICGKLLNCGFHECSDVCHHGPCKPCDLKVKMNCKCEKVTKEVPCGSQSFSCEQICGKTQRCGNCKCDYECHSGPNCPPCETDPLVVSTCPCGKKPLSTEAIAARTSCKDPIPCCDDVCGKMLPCGLHFCEEKCHEGPCPKCTVKRTASCPCGYNSKKVRCFEARELSCNKTCGATMTCGRHTCKDICCPHRRNPDPNSVAAHQCTETCGRQLLCGCQCNAICHRGTCPSCPNWILEDLMCGCGAQYRAAPLPCGTKLPPCHQPCPRLRTCGHNSRKHTCHFGDCPPCEEPVHKPCGSHGTEIRVQCSTAEVVCGKICGKPLPYCGHPCPRPCHSASESCTAKATKKFCQERCGRLLNCGGGDDDELGGGGGGLNHRCQAKCHVNHGAATEEEALKKPCPPCNNQVEIPCSCGIQVITFACRDYLDWRALNPNKKTAPCLVDCSKKRKEAARRPDSVADPNSTYFDSAPTVFSCKLWSAAKEFPDFFCLIEKQLAAVIKDKDGFKKLNPMNRDRRVLVHELCWHYHIQTESVDVEPKRAVLATRTPASKAPSPLLSDAIYTSDKKGHNPFVLIERVLSSPQEAKKSIIVFEGERLVESDLLTVLRPFVGKVVLVSGIDQIRTVPNLAPDASTKFCRGEVNAVLAVFSAEVTCSAAFSHLKQSMCKFLFHMFGEEAPPRNVEDSMGRLRLVQTNAQAFTNLSREQDNIWDDDADVSNNQNFNSGGGDKKSSSKKSKSSSKKDKKKKKKSGDDDGLDWLDGGGDEGETSRNANNDEEGTTTNQNDSDDDEDDSDAKQRRDRKSNQKTPAVVVQSVWNTGDSNKNAAAASTSSSVKPSAASAAPGAWASLLKK